ncbi:MAG: winged helix-turn-helix transcriptional regulator [Candidatus Heimdallarchaeota archaeon]
MKKRHELVSERTLGLIHQRILEQPGVTSRELAMVVALSERTVRAATKQLVLRGIVQKRKSLADLRHSHFFSAPLISEHPRAAAVAVS